MMFNYFGGPEEVLLRENFKIYDSNAFVTSWVTIIQLEAALFPGGPALGEEQLLLALDSLQSYQDRNRQEGSSLLVFWPQTFNETTGVWVSEAINLGNMLGDENMLNDVLISLLKDLNLKNQSENLRELATRV